MKNKTARFVLNNLLILTMVLGSLFVSAFPRPAQATTINVPSDNATIQQAIDFASPGDTINVAAGTYPESLVIGKGLTLHGATGAIINPATGPGIQINASSNNSAVTIEGFTISPQASTQDTAQGIVIGSVAAPTATSGITIRNNTITTVGINMGILVRGVGTNGPGYPNCTGLTVINNTINVGGDSTAFYASWVTPAHTGWTIIGNTFSSPIGVNLELYDVEDVLVDNNTFQAAGSGGSGNVFVSAELSNLSKPIIFSNNDVLGNGAGTMVAFNCNMQTGGTSTMNGVNITGNTFDNWVAAGRALGIFPRVTNVAIHQNNFLGTATELGLRNTSNVTVDATLNWWNNVSGPSHDGLVFGAGILEQSGAIIYSPWLTAATSTGPALAVITAAPMNASLHQPYTFTLAAIGGTPPYHWLAYSGFPGWLSLSDSGVLSGTPTTSGVFNIGVQVRDANQGIRKYLSLYVTTTPLEITTSSLPVGDINFPYSQTLHANGGTGSYLWTIIGGALPTGLSITDNVTGVISGTPTVGGPFNFTVQVDDGSTTATRDLSITISTDPLNITETTLPNGGISQPYSQRLHATGGSGTYTWSLANGTLPNGLTIVTDNNTGLISGTPTATGTSSFTVRVNDGYQTDDQALTLSISLAIITTTLPDADAGFPYNATLQASGGSGSYTWSIVVPGTGTLPPGLTLNTSTGVISGTTTSIATYPFTARVTDGVSSDTQDLSITVNYVQKLMGTIEGNTPAPGGIAADNLVMGRFVALADGNVNHIRVRCSGSGSVKAALYSDNTTPEIPQTGLLLNANNTGAPVASGWNNISLPITAVTAGTHYWIVTNSNAAILQYANITGPYTSYRPQLYTDNFTDTIGAPSFVGLNTEPLVSAWGTSTEVLPLDITTTSPLPSGFTDIPYSQTLTATGGTRSYTWSKVSGNLPTGLSINAGTGVISGTPTANGTFNFIAMVSDGVATDNQSLSVMIQGQQMLVGTSTQGTGNVSAGYICLSKFTATATSTVNVMKVYGTASGNVKVAIYADNAGQPGAQLNANNAGTAVTGGQWSSVPIASTSVTAGTPYWLAVNMDTNNAVTKVISPNPFRLASVPYINGCPAVLPELTTADTIYLCIAGWGPPSQLEITTTSLPDGSILTPYSQTLHAIGGTGNYVWSLESGSLPPGLSITDNVSGIISGTPTTIGPFPFVAQVFDGTSTDNQSLSITISAMTQKLVGTSTTGTGTFSASYIGMSRYTATGAGTVKQIRVYGTAAGHAKVAIYGDNLGEPGTLLNANNTSTAVLAGQWNNITITDTPVTAGTAYWLAVILDTDNAVTKVVSANPFRYKYQDYGAFGSWPATVSGLLPADTIYLCLAGWGSPGPLAVVTTSLPGGTVGIPYSQNLQASGGTDNYTWSILSGSLPDGLILTDNVTRGLISGTPTVANTFNFIARVSDGLTTADSASIPIIIQPAATLLVGTDNTSTGAFSGSYIGVSRFTATGSGTVTQLRVYGTANGSVKVAIYADSGGQPGTLIYANNNDNPVTMNTWSTITIPGQAVTTGTPYWIAVIANGDNVVTKTIQTNPFRYKYQIYYGFSWPATLTGLSTSDTVYLSIGGWGL